MWLRLVWRGLSRNARRTAFALAIVAVGTVAGLAVAGYVLTTFIAVREATIRNGVAHLQIAKPAEFSGYEDRILENGLEAADVQAVRAAVSTLPRVVLLLPRLGFQALVSNGERTLVALGEGVDPVSERRLAGPATTLVAGHGLEAAGSSASAAVIGSEMATLLGVTPGEVITILAAAVGGGVNAVDAEVVGVFSTGVAELDRMRVLVPLPLAQELLRTHSVRRVALQLDDVVAVDRVSGQLAERLPELSVRKWHELAPFYRQLVALYSRQAAVFAMVIGVVIVIVVFGVIAMSVLERRREIGVLRSLGIPAQRVRRLFLLEGALLGGLGGVSGVSLALVLFAAVNAARIGMPPAPGYTQSYPLFISFSLPIAVAIVLTMVLLSLAASWAASRRATCGNIAESMRRG